MSVRDEEFKTVIYDLMNGAYNLDECEIEESKVVEDEFAEGKYCGPPPGRPGAEL